MVYFEEVLIDRLAENLNLMGFKYHQKDDAFELIHSPSFSFLFFPGLIRRHGFLEASPTLRLEYILESPNTIETDVLGDECRVNIAQIPVLYMNSVLNSEDLDFSRAFPINSIEKACLVADVVTKVVLECAMPVLARMCNFDYANIVLHEELEGNGNYEDNLNIHWPRELLLFFQSLSHAKNQDSHH